MAVAYFLGKQNVILLDLPGFYQNTSEGVRRVYGFSVRLDDYVTWPVTWRAEGRSGDQAMLEIG